MKRFAHSARPYIENANQSSCFARIASTNRINQPNRRIEVMSRSHEQNKPIESTNRIIESTHCIGVESMNQNNIQNDPKRPSKRAPKPPRAPQDPLKTAQKPPKTRQRGPKSPQERPKTPPRRPKTPPRALLDGLDGHLGTIKQQDRKQDRPGPIWEKNMGRFWSPKWHPKRSQNRSKN